MKVIVTKNYAESCQVVAKQIITQIKADPASKLGLATGGTAEPIYPLLVKAYQEGQISFANISTVNLDEYIGLDPSAPQSYRNYMDGLLFNHIDIDKSRTYVPSGTNDIDAEIALFNEKLAADRLIDIQLLGIGVSGHIGFNEPNEHLVAGVHIEHLDESTITANSRFFSSSEEVPTMSITMGVGDIMKARSIVLIATGKNKAPAMKRLLMDDYITPAVPATVLKMHADATIVIDQELANEIGFVY
ncbi:MAG: glucosamine-6-phosphate deaminase [Tyzzerella sp.]|nr:glucosamine-6-phosphate deaminase [Tyzzerella sp.]